MRARKVPSRPVTYLPVPEVTDYCRRRLLEVRAETDAYMTALARPGARPDMRTIGRLLAAFSENVHGLSSNEMWES